MLELTVTVLPLLLFLLTLAIATLGTIGAARASGKFVQNVRVDKADFFAIGNFHFPSAHLHQLGSIITGDVNTEVSRSFETKDISVPRLSSNIDRRLGIFPNKFLLYWSDQRINAGKTDSLFEAGEKSGFAVPLVGSLWVWVWDFPGISERERANKSRAVALKIAGRSRATIFHNDAKLNRLSEAKFAEKNVRIYVGAKLSHGNISNNHESDKERDGLKGSDNNRSDTDISCGFIRRLTLLILSILAGLGLALWGGMRLDYERPLFSASIVGAAIVIPSVGWVLYGATLFPSTCGWPL